MICLVIGACVGLTNLFAPIHEAGHVLTAHRNGTEAHFSTWSSTFVDPKDFAARVTAGWFGELAVFGVLALVFVAAGRRHPLFTGGFPIGYMVTTWARGFGSTDFTVGVVEYVNSFPRLSETQRAVSTDWYSTRVLVVWAIVGAVAIGLLVALAISQVKRKRPPEGRGPV